MKVNLIINGRHRQLDIDPNEYLLDTLRNEHITSVKRGCDTSSCGVCTILLEGSPVASCSYLTAMAEGLNITTVEGIQEEAAKLAELFGREGADQCGYCTPGLALTVYAMKNELNEKSDDAIRDYLVGNLCRCTGYVAQHKAIKKYLEVV